MYASLFSNFSTPFFSLRIYHQYQALWPSSWTWGGRIEGNLQAIAPTRPSSFKFGVLNPLILGRVGPLFEQLIRLIELRSNFPHDHHLWPAGVELRDICNPLWPSYFKFAVLNPLFLGRACLLFDWTIRSIKSRSTSPYPYDHYLWPEETESM